MSQYMPFGADTLVIPFTRVGGTAPRRHSGMSRMRPAGELFRYGVVRTAIDEAPTTPPAIPISDEIPHAGKLDDDAASELEKDE